MNTTENNSMDQIISDEEKRKKKVRNAVKVTAAIIIIGTGIYGISQFMRSRVGLDSLIVDEVSVGTIETTINANGQGIGMMIVRDILAKHHSTFSLSTDTDGLTRFRIQFPPSCSTPSI